MRQCAAAIDIMKDVAILDIMKRIDQIPIMEDEAILGVVSVGNLRLLRGYRPRARGGGRTRLRTTATCG